MPKMDFDVSDFKKAGLSPERVISALSSIGISALQRGTTLEVEATPNRPDLLELSGVIRAVNLRIGRRKPKVGFYSPSSMFERTIYVGAGVSDMRPFIAGMTIFGVDLAGSRLKSLINFTEKLAETYGRGRRKLALGLHNLDAIKGDLLYDASAEGKITPLNGTEKMPFGEVLSKNEKGIEYRSTLNGSKAMPFLADSEKVIALIPIINSNETKVTVDTRNLFIDMTGLTEGIVKAAANLLACSFIDQGYKVVPCRTHYARSNDTNPDLEYVQFKIKLSTIEGTVGCRITQETAARSAERLGNPVAKYGNSLLVWVPPYRTDVLNEQDVIEDIAIGYGYDRILQRPVHGTSTGHASAMTDMLGNIAINMVGLGFSEAINNVLTNGRTNFSNMLVDENSHAKSTISLVHSKTELLSMLRTSLLPGLLSNLSASANEPMPQRLFETGSIFAARPHGFREDVLLSFVVEHSKADFAEAKGVVSALLKVLDTGTYSVKAAEYPYFIPGRCAEIIKDGKRIGAFGEVHPEVLKNFGLEEPAIAAEITLLEDVSY